MIVDNHPERLLLMGGILVVKLYGRPDARMVRRGFRLGGCWVHQSSAARIAVALHLRDRTPVLRILAPVIRWLRLDSVGPAKELDVNFSPGTNLLTGDNGLGKTFLLDIAWWALTGSWVAGQALPAHRGSTRSTIAFALESESDPDEVREAEWNDEAQRWPSSRSDAGPGLAIYARVDGGFAVWDPLRTVGNSKRHQPMIFTPQAVWDGLKIGRVPACRGLIEDVATWQLQRGDAYDQFVGVLRQLSPRGHELSLAPEPGRASAEDVRDVPMLEAPYGNVPLTHASAGVKRVVQLAYLLVWAWREHEVAAERRFARSTSSEVVMLVDEIEAHLHPRWQKEILPALRSVVDALSPRTNVQLVVATHSPLVLSSLDPVLSSKRDRLLTLDLAEEGPNVGHPILIEQEWTPRSDAAAWLGSDAFDGVSARPRQIEEVLERFKRAADSDDAAAARQSYWQLAEWVAPDDPDLVRLRALLSKRDWYELRFSHDPEESA